MCTAQNSKQQTKRTRGSEFRAPLLLYPLLAACWRCLLALLAGAFCLLVHTSARPSAANTGTQHCFLASASDPKLWPDVYKATKLNMAVAYEI
jgi:hypothetical protein